MQTSGVSTRGPRTAADVTLVRNLIGGQWVDAPEAELIDTFNPATGEVIGTAPLSKGVHVDQAVQAAVRAFEGWKETPVVQRARVMIRYRQKIEEHFDDLVRIITTNQGKTHAEARGSVMRAIECVEVAIAG